jgi:hypothetical protein
VRVHILDYSPKLATIDLRVVCHLEKIQQTLLRLRV